MGNLSLAGKKVQHTAFGPGTILKQDGDYITVQFCRRENVCFSRCVFSIFTRADRTLQQKLEASMPRKTYGGSAERLRPKRRIYRNAVSFQSCRRRRRSEAIAAAMQPLNAIMMLVKNRNFGTKMATVTCS